MQAEIEALHDRRPGEDTNQRWLRIAMRGCLGAVNEMTMDWLAHGLDTVAPGRRPSTRTAFYVTQKILDTVQIFLCAVS